MKLAFYYHIPITSSDEGFKIPSYLGVFLKALADEVDHLQLVMHEANTQETENCNYVLEAENVTWVNLGKKTPAWHRALFHKKLLKKKLLNLDAHCFLVRSPSPLAPYFHKYFSPEKICFFIVGDYESSVQNSQKNLRQLAIDLYLRYNIYLFKKAIKKTKILVNSPELYEKYQNLAPNINLVGTTTLSQRDFFQREDTCQGEIIKLLYTGRIDLQKGLLELINVSGELIHEGVPVELHLVGWEEKVDKPIEKLLIERAREWGIMEKVFFHGKKKVGEELNQMYRMADIYVIPSYHEGFPRTIWEAMANSLPVIATEVGAIPTYLTSGENAILIPPKDEKFLLVAIKNLMNDAGLRKKIIQKGRNRASSQTLEILTKKLVELLN